MTIIELREIAAESGLSHAEFCLEQLTTQIGSEAAEPLWAELTRMRDADFGSAPSEYNPDDYE